MAKRQRWLYLIGSDEVRPVKIGISFDPDKRLEELQVGSPVTLRLLWKTPGGREMEQALHERFRSYCKHGEWFDFGEENPVALVAGTAALLGYWRPPLAVTGLVDRLISTLAHPGAEEPGEQPDLPRIVLPRPFGASGASTDRHVEETP